MKSLKDNGTTYIILDSYLKQYRHLDKNILTNGVELLKDYLYILPESGKLQVCIKAADLGDINTELHCALFFK